MPNDKSLMERLEYLRMRAFGDVPTEIDQQYVNECAVLVADALRAAEGILRSIDDLLGDLKVIDTDDGTFALALKVRAYLAEFCGGKKDEQ